MTMLDPWETCVHGVPLSAPCPGCEFTPKQTQSHHFSPTEWCKQFEAWAEGIEPHELRKAVADGFVRGVVIDEQEPHP